MHAISGHICFTFNFKHEKIKKIDCQLHCRRQLFFIRETTITKIKLNKKIAFRLTLINYSNFYFSNFLSLFLYLLVVEQRKIYKNFERIYSENHYF